MIEDFSSKKLAAEIFCQVNIVALCAAMVEFGETGILKDGLLSDLKRMTGYYAGSAAMACAERMISQAAIGMVAQNNTLTLHEVWVAAGGNPGIIPTREDVFLSLKTLDEICDAIDSLPSASTK